MCNLVHIAYIINGWSLGGHWLIAGRWLHGPSGQPPVLGQWELGVGNLSVTCNISC